MDNKYLTFLATSKLTITQYKILLLMNVKAYTQAQIAELINVKNQNVYASMKELIERNLIIIDRIEGRNKFYKAVVDIEKINQAIPGQTEIKF